MSIHVPETPHNSLVAGTRRGVAHLLRDGLVGVAFLAKLKGALVSLLGFYCPACFPAHVS